MFREEVGARLDAAKSETFAANLRSLFAKARDRASASHLEVIHSPDVPLLIGDAAVLSIQAGGGVGFIPFSDAGTHVLPVGPHHLVGLGRSDQILEIANDLACQLNEQ